MSQVIRKAAWDLFNAIDSDLDICDYTDNESSTTVEALERFEATLATGTLLTRDDEVEETEDVPIVDILDLETDDLE